VKKRGIKKKSESFRWNRCLDKGRAQAGRRKLPLNHKPRKKACSGGEKLPSSLNSRKTGSRQGTYCFSRKRFSKNHVIGAGGIRGDGGALRGRKINRLNRGSFTRINGLGVAQ